MVKENSHALSNFSFKQVAILQYTSNLKVPVCHFILTMAYRVLHVEMCPSLLFSTLIMLSSNSQNLHRSCYPHDRYGKNHWKFFMVNSSLEWLLMRFSSLSMISHWGMLNTILYLCVNSRSPSKKVSHSVLYPVSLLLPLSGRTAHRAHMQLHMHIFS